MKIKILAVVVCSLMYATLFGQQQNAADSIRKDSSEVEATVYIFQQKQQQKKDSIAAADLQAKLLEADGDAKTQAKLVQQLREITERDSIRQINQKARVNRLKNNAVAYPVTLLSDTLFYINTRLGGFSAAARAKAVSERLAKLYDVAFFNPDSLKIVDNEVTTDVVYSQENTILSVTDLDALWYDKTPEILAGEYLNIIKEEIITLREQNSFKNWLKRIAYVAFIIIGIWLIVYAINKLFRRINALLYRNKAKYFNGITIKKVNVLSAGQHYFFAIRVNNLLRVAIIILALYLALPLLFSVFPQTESLAHTLITWILTPAKAILRNIINFLPNLFTILVIYIATVYLIKVVKYFAIEIRRGTMKINGFYPDWAMPTFNIVRVLIYAFMFVVIFPYLPGSQSPAFQGVTVFLGVLISLGSSSAVANLVAGLVITYMRAFKNGDRVKIGEVTGDVIEKTLLVTRLRTIKNEDITVPNSNVLSNHTINYSSLEDNEGLIIHTSVTIGYDVPWKDIHQALIDAALRTDEILKHPQPFVLQTSLEDFYVSYQLNAYIRNANRQAIIYSEMHKNIQDVCNERGIEIMSPHYSALRDGNQTTIPQDYRPQGYKTPSFNLNTDNGDAANNKS